MMWHEILRTRTLAIYITNLIDLMYNGVARLTQRRRREPQELSCNLKRREYQGQGKHGPRAKILQVLKSFYQLLRPRFPRAHPVPE